MGDEPERMGNRGNSSTSNTMDHLETGPDELAQPYSRPREGDNQEPFESDDTLQETETQPDPEKGGVRDRTASGYPVRMGFFHESLNEVRWQVFRGWARTTVILCVFILAVLSLYWGALFHVERNMSALVTFVVDFDGQVAPYNTGGSAPLVGPLVVAAARQQLASPEPHLGFEIWPPSHFHNDPMEVRQRVYDQKAWAAIIVNANATAMLRHAVETGDASYDPMGAGQVIWVEARDQQNADYYMPLINQLTTQVSTEFGAMWTRTVMRNTSIPRTNLERAPQALAPGIGFSMFNLRPFGPPQVTPAVTVGLIYLIILAFFSYSFFLPIHMKFIVPKGHAPLHFGQLILWRWVATVTAYFFMSFAYSLVSLAFQIPFSHQPGLDTSVVANANAYGHGSWVVYWMLNFVGMSALGLACENVAMLVGQPWTALWLIFWVIMNVCTAFYSIDLAPRFYYWGYAWPLHNIVEASRTILFDTHSRIGLNFGVLFTWAAVNSVFFPICCHFMRWQTDKENRESRRGGYIRHVATRGGRRLGVWGQGPEGKEREEDE